MRIRSIKPEFWRSDDIAALSIEDRLLFIGLWSYVDDSGVGEDKLASICGDLFAPDMEKDAPEVFARVRRGLQELSDRGLIVRYAAAGKRYLAVTAFGRHQRIDKPSKSRYPGLDQAEQPDSGRAPGALREGSRSPPGGLDSGSNYRTSPDSVTPDTTPEQAHAPRDAPQLADPGGTDGSDDPTPTDHGSDQAEQPDSGSPREDSGSPPGAFAEPSPAGTGEQGNRGTGEQGKTDSSSPSARADARDDGSDGSSGPEAETDAAPPARRSASTREQRGTRLPDGFEPDDELIQWARDNAPTCGRSDHEAFVDYWRSVPGAKGRKVDWRATWRNWMRREHDRRPASRASPASNGSRPSTSDQRVADTLALGQRLQARLDQQQQLEIGS